MTDLVIAPTRRQLFGLELDPMTREQVMGLTESSLQSNQRLLVGVVNAAKVVKLRQDGILRDSLLECDVLLADGQSVVWASRLLGQRLPERVTGIDLFEMMLGLAHRDGRSVYLLGATAEVLAEVERQIEVRWPGLRIAGSRNGYFEESQSAEIAADIAGSGADMLFLGMTSPKKEIFLGTFGASLDVPVQHGVGGSFDILAGLTKRAPDRWQRIGMEWAFRLLQEPGRLWKRYLTTNTAFLFLLLRERVHRSPLYTPTARPAISPPEHQNQGVAS